MTLSPTTRDSAILGDIFAIAASHDRTTASAYRKVSQRLGFQGRSGGEVTVNVLDAEEEVSALVAATEDLCAALAPAAKKRLRALRRTDRVEEPGDLFDLPVDRLSAILGDIFTAAGIEDRFDWGGWKGSSLIDPPAE